MKIPNDFTFFQRPRGKIFIICALVVWGLVFQVGITFSQESSNRRNDEFVHLGLISYLKKYEVAKDGSHIIFKIRNNGNLSISTMFAWVYRYTEGPDGKPIDWILVNNPHKGGIKFLRTPHPPGKIKKWRFPIIRRFRLVDIKEKYALRISQKSIFFATIEPPGEPIKKNKKKRKSEASP